MSFSREKWQQRNPKQRKSIKWRSLLALILSLSFFLQSFGLDTEIVLAEEYKRIALEDRLTMANHWRFSRWSDGVKLCDIYVTHTNYPSEEEIRSYCGEELLLNWRETPACEEALFGKDASECEGVFIGYLGKSINLVKEIVELPEVELKVETLNCFPGEWCNERLIMRFIGEEPLTDHHIVSMHVKIGSTEKSCEGGSCDLRMPITYEQGMDVEYWARSDFGDESERKTFTLRNVPDESRNGMFRVDLIHAGLDSSAPAGSEEWDLFPTINHQDSILLEKPATFTNLSTQNRFLYLAGKLILTGKVDGSTCSGFGLIDNNTANPCGERLAEEKVLEWQNQYDEQIFQSSLEFSVPPRLLKGIIAQETQFWPHPVHAREFGLGRITENGADLLLNWNTPIFLEKCHTLIPVETCAAGYSNLEPEEQSLLRGLVLSDVGTDQEIALLAATFKASSTQVSQMVKNITLLQINEVSTYEEMWKISVANYHAGSGCVGTAMQTAWSNGDQMIWESIYPNLLGDCMGAVEYVESVYDLAD